MTMESTSFKPYFSLTYNGKRFQPSGDGPSWKLDDTLTVTLEAIEYPEFNAVHWFLIFENSGTQNSGILSDIWDCDVSFPFPYKPIQRPGYLFDKDAQAVTVMQGMVGGETYSIDDAASATEYSTKDVYFLPWRRRRPVQFSNINSRSSEGTIPFFELKSEGRGAIAAIGWTGAWKAEVQSTDATLEFRSGLQNARFYLKPGEKLRTTSILIMEYAKGEDASNKFRRLMREHFSHRACTPATRDGLLAFEQWGGLPSEMMKARIAELKAHSIRFEDLWIDAGWYGQCTKCDDPFSGDWWQFTGEWCVNRRIHPNGMEDVRDTAATAGMKPMIWIEPERTFSNLPVPQSHPDWFLKLKNAPNGTPCSWILNYGNEDAFNYALTTISDLIRTLNMGCYRQDFNTGLTEFFEDHDEPDRRGITEIKHICGMYRLWDTLLNLFPGLIIDNCSGGGRRIDLETLKRAIPFFRSDYQCAFNATAEVMQTHNAGAMRYFPFIGCTTKVCDLYTLRSSYASSFGVACYNTVFQSMTEEDFAVVRKAVDDYRRIRHYLSLDFHNHGSAVFDLSSWAIWQYHDPDSGNGIVIAFRRPQSPFSNVDITLKGNVAPALTVTNLDDGSTSIINDGHLTLRLPQPRSSVILEYNN
ncbi:MAG: alpha-galactosidase [Victivallales bacterium]|nr:alpha-galactosidase [Victivallales bacterium]